MLTEMLKAEPTNATEALMPSADPLWQTFPMTLSLLGNSRAARAVADFHRWRKESARANEARQFALFVQDGKWGGELAFLPALAEIEWAIAEIQTEPELPVHGLERIPDATDEDWDKARFFFDPGHRVIAAEWNLAAILQDLRGSHERSLGSFLVYRHHGKPKVRPLKPSEAELIAALDLGVPLGVIQDRPNGPDLDSFLFHKWIESGFLRAIHWPLSSSA